MGRGPVRSRDPVAGRRRTGCREALGGAALTEARREGAALDATAAVAVSRRTRGATRATGQRWGEPHPDRAGVCALVAEGLTNERVGERLLMTAGTVRTHLGSVFGRLGVASRTQLAAAWSRRAG